MPMRNLDTIRQQFAADTQNLMSALQEGNAEAAAKAMQSRQENLLKAIEAEFEQYANVQDMNVLQQRGLCALTKEENEWYDKFMQAARSDAPKQAITNLTTAMPVTIIDRVIEDMRKAHPLLDALTIQNAGGATKLVLNAVQMAAKLGTWGVVTTAITEELTGAIDVVDVAKAKYTAFFLIPKDFVKFNFSHAPMWVDQYIRVILSESVAYGLESTIIGGTGAGTGGVQQFIGMTMNVSTNSNGTYSAKTAVAITDFGDDYADVIATLAVDDNGNYREPGEVLLVVNPIDNIKKIRKYQNAITHAGVLDLISQTYPTKVVTSALVEQGKAVVGIAKNYFAAINGGESGIIDYSDEAQFLNDVRVYTTRVYGYGRPVDNHSFALLDISGVGSPRLPVDVIGTVASAAETTTETDGEG